MRLPRPTSFRALILLALVGTVGALLAVTILILRWQTDVQVAAAVERTVERSRRTFAQQEAFRRTQLLSNGTRFAAGNRFAAELDEAVNSGDLTNLRQTVDYDRQLFREDESLFAFTTLDGGPVLTMVGGGALEDPAAGVPEPLLRRVLERAETNVLGYHLLGSRIYTVHTVLLTQVDFPVGTLTLGTPLDDRVARQLGDAIGTDVCFVAAGRCVASTLGPADGALRAEMVRAAGSRQSRRVEIGGRRMELVADREGDGAAGVDVWRVTAVPLDDVIRPFEAIRTAEALAGLLSLALAVAVGAYLARKLTKPVTALVGATKRVGAGDYDVRVAVDREDELGTLSAAFNEMTEGLRQKERMQALLNVTASPEVAEELLRRGTLELGGENREVTILFSDIRGFTSLTEGMEPQEVIALVNEVMRTGTEAIMAEDGVVDKFVGDNIMALWGAPVSRPDDARRAVRAALRMQAALRDGNARRRAAGLPPVEIGIGINTGIAVAGNMGSLKRFNYTVLGESVNVAARLCSNAGRGEVLVSQATLDRLGPGWEAAPKGPLALKGLSQPVPVFSVTRGPSDDDDASPSLAHDEGDETDGNERSGDAGRAAAAGRAGALGLAAALALASPAAAQGVALPTLEELGVGWTSPGGTVQVTFSGRAEVTAYAPGEDRPWLIAERDPFVAPRISLFTDVLIGERLYAFAELRADRGVDPGDRPMQGRVEQAFVRWTPFAGRSLGVQAGKFVTPFGGYTQRHHTRADPLVRPPLMYDWRTPICAGVAPGAVRGFLNWKDDPVHFRPMGAPVVWGVPYQAGAMAFGTVRGVTLRAAVLNSAPSSAPSAWDPDWHGEQAPSFVAAAQWQPLPELGLRAFYNVGPYLERGITGPMPAGTDWKDYDQELYGAEATIAAGRVEARAEVVWDRWEVPNLPEDPRDVSYYLEGRVALTPGLFVAGRYNAIRFSSLDVGTPGPADEKWDHDVERLQLGAGYRLGRTTEVRAEYARTTSGGGVEPDDDLLSLQIAYTF